MTREQKLILIKKFQWLVEDENEYVSTGELKYAIGSALFNNFNGDARYSQQDEIAKIIIQLMEANCIVKDSYATYKITDKILNYKA